MEGVRGWGMGEAGQGEEREGNGREEKGRGGKWEKAGKEIIINSLINEMRWEIRGGQGKEGRKDERGMEGRDEGTGKVHNLRKTTPPSPVIRWLVTGMTD